MMKQFGNGFECLEDRTLLAANVTAELIGGTLFVTGDDTANYITVEDDGGLGKVEVDVGFEQSLKVIGGTAVDANTGSFSGVRNIVVLGGAGNDLIFVGGDGNDAVNIAGSLLMNGGKGDDHLSVYGVYRNGDTLAEAKQIEEVGYDIGGSVVMNGGMGNDDIEIERMSVGGNVLILGGAGNDDVDVSYNDIGGNATILGQAGNDRICFEQNYISGYALISGGLGNDSAYFGSSSNQTAAAVGSGGSYLGSNWVGGSWATFVENELENCPFDVR